MPLYYVALRTGPTEPAEWPGRDRREPRPTDPHYLPLVGLAHKLRSAVDRQVSGRQGLRVVDLGCGQKPYRPWIASAAAEYIGVDAHPGPHVDHVAPAERLDFLDSGSVDLVLCTQVLEHADDPRKVVDEIRRVLRPAGVCLLSTHGVFPYHGQPQDYWRWTHSGLERLFRESGFEDVSVEATDGIASAILGAVDFYVWTLADRYGIWRFLRYTAHPLLGLLAPRLDRYLGWTFADHPMAINYLVVARARA